MSAYQFGSGVLFGTPLTTASGVAIPNPTPVQFGVLQDVTLDFSFDIKELFGQYQYAVAVGRGKGKSTGKAKFAQINGGLLNSLFFGQTLVAGGVSDVVDTTGTAIPGTPFQITVTPPNTGTWAVDLGVKTTAGLPLTKVASAPTTGQYSVAAGVYTFASADTGTTVFINYQYTYTSTTAQTQTINNVLMGQAPTFQAEFFTTYGGKNLSMTFLNCIGTKLAFATKLDDFMIPEFDFSMFAGTSGFVKISTTDI